MKSILVVQGTDKIDAVPRLGELADRVEIRLTQTNTDLSAALPGADALLLWQAGEANLAEAWQYAGDLRWIHRCGAGVDAIMFPGLVESQVQVTNARGIFDLSMAEWTLGMILSFAKQFTQTYDYQTRCEWRYRMTENIAGKQVLLVGVGSIGRCIARLLGAAGMQLEAIGRSARDGDPDFGHVYAVDELRERLPLADYVVLVTPLTEQTRKLFGADEFAAMAPHARFINLGRGPLVDERALLAALRDAAIAGAALDVFVEEPLPADSPFWQAPNCLVSPHMSGDFLEFEEAIMDQFLLNWERYRNGEPLLNLVDKTLGFVSQPQ